MALPRKTEHQLEWALIFTLCFMTLAILPSKSVGRMMNVDETKEMMKLVLGSKPPRCINKCMNCKPCRAVLVVPSHKKMQSLGQKSSALLSPELATQGEENYYLVSWKCKCKDKLFQP